MTENPDRQQKGQTDFRILVAFTLCLVLITLTYTFAQVISSDADIPVSSERIITNAADLEIWLNDGTQLKYLVNELVIDFEEFRPLAVRDQLVPVISNSAAVFPVFMKQAAGGFQLFNADAALIYQSRNQKPSAEAEALLVPLSELDLWLYAGELLETHSTQSQHDSLPLKNETEDQPLLKKNAVVEKEETTTAEVSDSVPEVAALPKLLERLAEELAEQQAQWFPIMPPSTNLVLTLMAQPTPTLMQVSELMDGLVSEKREDYTVYPVTGMERENKGIRERIFYNRNGELLGVVPCESDYNPSAWVENKYSDLYERDQEETDWLKNVYDPRRLNITFDLTLSRPKKVSKSRIGSKTELVSVPVRRSSGSGTNLTIGSILKTGDTVKVTVVYPASYTNRIDIYSCTDLVAGDWTLRHTTDIEASTNFVEWEDADCTNWQIYAAGNADYDGDEDGVSDAREIFITKTDPADPNDPPSIAGSISYSGFQTNTIKVIAVTDSDIWASDDSVLISQPGAYRITGLSHTGYWIKAFRDLNGDGLKDFMEASGSSVSIVSATGAMSGVNFTLTEPDTDSDGFSEYEELVIFKTDPNNGGDQYPQGTGTSVTVYYGHPSIGSTDWVYGTSAFYLYDEVSMGKGWIVGDEFVPDLHQESSTIYYGQPDYSDCPDTFVYAPDAFMNNDVSMGKGWAAQEGFVTDFRQASQQINYAQPDYFGHMDLYVYTYTANAYSEMVGRGWLRPGSFVPDLTELSHLVYWGLPSSLPQTNITKDSFILATSSLDDDVMQGTGWATPDGFLADLSSGVGPVYYGNPVGYSNIWVFGRSSFDLDNDEQIGIGWVNLYDFITYDEPDTDLDDDNQMDGYDPFVAEGYTPPNDSLTANLNLYIHDTSSFSERYALSVGPYLAVMPGTGQLAEASGQVERGTVYEDAYIESLPDGDDDGDYNAHVTGYGVYVDDPNGYLGDKTDTGFNSGKRYFDVYFPLTGISGYRPGLKTSPGSAVSRVHEDDPRYLVVMVNDDNDDGGAAGHHDYDDTVIGTNDNDIVKLTLEQFLPTALTKGTLELTVSPSNTIRLYRSNGNLLSNYTLNLANKQGDLYYLTAMDIDLYAEALTNCADVTISLAYKDTNGVEVCRDEGHLSAISIGFVDDIPDYAKDSNSDSDNYYLRENNDHQNLDVYYRILPVEFEPKDVLISIYEGTNSEPYTTLSGEQNDSGVYKTGYNLYTNWTPTINLQESHSGFYRLQLSVYNESSTGAVCSTSIDDADASSPGWQCPNNCLCVHDLQWKHRPIVYVSTNDLGRPSNQDEFISSSGTNINEWISSSSYTNHQPASSPLPYNTNCFWDLFCDDVATVGDLTDLTNEISVYETDAGTENIFYSSVTNGSVGGSTNYVFLQYWMFYNFSQRPHGVLGDIGAPNVQHEGDLEHCQIAIRLLDVEAVSNKANWFMPFGATASQHYYGQTLPWNHYNGVASPNAHSQTNVEHFNNRLVIYIALGAHATYFVADPDIDVPDTDAYLGTQEQYDSSPNLAYDATYEDVALSYTLSHIDGWLDIYEGYWGYYDPDDIGLTSCNAPPGTPGRHAKISSSEILNIRQNPRLLHNYSMKTSQTNEMYISE